MSNLGKWNASYSRANLDEISYGDGVTYLMAAAFLADVDEVEDWGCGTGAFRRFCKTKYIGIDGSKTPYADKIVDLEEYRTNCSGIMLRHVLEHNYNWERILTNAVLSFRHKLFLCLFTPFADSTREIVNYKDRGMDVPDLSFSRSDIEKYFTGLKWTLFEDLKTDTQYKTEHVYLIWR